MTRLDLADVSFPTHQGSRQGALPEPASRAFRVNESDVDDQLGFDTIGVSSQDDGVSGGRFDDCSHAMTGPVQDLAVQHAMNHPVLHAQDLDSAHDEFFDLVDVETLVDPVDQEPLGRVALGSNLPVLRLENVFGGHDDPECAKRDLAEGVRQRRAPTTHANVRLHVEVLPAGERGGRHRGLSTLPSPGLPRPRSPKWNWRTASTAGPAVSVRRIRGPILATRHPAPAAAETSSRDRPPSGPMRTAAE